MNRLALMLAVVATVVGLGAPGADAAGLAIRSRPPAGSGDFVLPPDWVWLVDDTQSITVAVPSSWADVSTAPQANDDGSVRPHIAAATDYQMFRDTFDAPGVEFISLPYDPDPQAVMDRFGLEDGCQINIRPYDDGAFVGLHGVWSPCGPTGVPEWHQVVASPADQSRTLLLQIQIPLPSEGSDLDNILRSFNLTPAAGSGAPATLAVAPTTTVAG